MSFVISAIQSYNNIIQRSDAEAGIQNNNEARINAIKSLDMNAIQSAGPSDPTVMALSSADKKMVLQNANNGLKIKCLETWQNSIDEKMKKEIAKEFSLGLD